MFNINSDNQNKEQWPASYLNTWQAFSSDERSVKYLCALLDYHIPNITNLDFKIADIMCGSGKVGKAVKSHIVDKGGKCSVTYIDSSSVILDSVELDIDKDKTLVGDIANLVKVDSNTFDIIVCRYGFNNLPKEDWSGALDESLRILKPGGLFLLQDHFIPGSVFSELVNDAEQFLARLENKKNTPFIFSTEEFNRILDEHVLVASRIKAGYGFFINIWDRLKAKYEIIKDFDSAKQSILDFYRDTCLNKYKLLIVDPEEYIHVFNVTYAIVKKGE